MPRSARLDVRNLSEEWRGFESVARVLAAVDVSEPHARCIRRMLEGWPPVEIAREMGYGGKRPAHRPVVIWHRVVRRIQRRFPAEVARVREQMRAERGHWAEILECMRHGPADERPPGMSGVAPAPNAVIHAPVVTVDDLVTDPRMFLERLADEIDLTSF